MRMLNCFASVLHWNKPVTWLVRKFPVIRDLNAQDCVHKSPYTEVHDNVEVYDCVSSCCSELGDT